MKTIDAWWDTRSLGVRCAEVAIESTDTISDAIQGIDWAKQYDYSAIKVPADMPSAVSLVQENGWTYIESSLGMTIDLRKAIIPSFVERREKDFSWKKASLQSRNRIFEQIQNGVFDTDRIALDPVFGKKVAATRYINWISDEFENGASIYHVYYKDQEVAFFTMKEVIPKVECYPFLTGLYPEWQESGMGANATVVAAMREAQNQNYKRIQTHVSSNNLPIIRLHELIGYRVNEIVHVFIRHNDIEMESQ